MIPVKSFIEISSRDKILVLQSIFWIILIRIMVWIFPFHFVQKQVQTITRRYSLQPSIVTISRIRLMIVIVSRYVPQATCLIQAMAGHILLSKYGYTNSIKIGVLTENGEFEAHAWLEHNEKAVLGESEKKFKTMLTLD